MSPTRPRISRAVVVISSTVLLVGLLFLSCVAGGWYLLRETVMPIDFGSVELAGPTCDLRVESRSDWRLGLAAPRGMHSVQVRTAGQPRWIEKAIVYSRRAGQFGPSNLLFKGDSIALFYVDTAICVSVDAGRSWAMKEWKSIPGASGQLEAAIIHSVEMDENGVALVRLATVAAPTTAIRSARTTDGGRTWSAPSKIE